MKSRRFSSGQAAAEYVAAVVILVAVAAALYGLAAAVRNHGDRTVDLVSSEYP
ncbi:MAG: hypothetical protein IJS46_05065 [Kiritimatiellae bacterium]|nr:hypothetical protein [Kiritimatiellia bacterium]